jgi:hypothetical protein
MSKLTKAIALSLLLAVLFVPKHVLAAASFAPANVDLGPFLQIVAQVVEVMKGMTALATVLTLVVNYLKYRGWVPDGAADIAFQILNIAAIVVLSLVKFFNPAFDFGAFDAMLQALIDNFAVLVPALLAIPA